MERAEGWATPERLLAIADASGIESRETIEKRLESEALENKLQQTIERVRELSLSAIPRIVINGDATAPAVSFPSTRQQLRKAVDDASRE